MEGFTIVDGVVALVIVVSALLAYSRGLVREGLAIAGWVVAAILAFLFAGQAAPLVRAVPIIGDFIADSCELSIIAGAGVVFAVILMLSSIVTPLFSTLVQRSILGGVDQGLGFIFGVLRGILLVAVAFFIYQTFLSAQGLAMIDDSRAAAIFGGVGEQFRSQEPQALLGWVNQHYASLIGTCQG